MYCHPAYFLINLYAEYIMRNTGLEEAEAGIKIAGINIKNLRYADNTSLMAESEEELKSLLMKMTEESEKVGLKHNIQKTKIMAWVHDQLSPNSIFLQLPQELMISGGNLYPCHNIALG